MLTQFKEILITSELQLMFFQIKISYLDKVN